MPAVVQVFGLRQFTKYLRDVGGKTLPKRMRMANLTTSQFVADRVQARAPRGKVADRDPHPGQLAGKTKALATQRVGRVQIGRGLLYAKPIIFGWPAHHIKANPYPYEVLDEVRGELPEFYEGAVVDALKDAEV